MSGGEVCSVGRVRERWDKLIEMVGGEYSID